jgi:hypothetical protein
MGSASPVRKNAEVYVDEFEDLERKCRSNYFKQHVEEYRGYVNTAVMNNELAALDLLISGGSIEDVMPLHIAAKYGALDSLELLLSAGISPFAKDKTGGTPLHRAAGKFHPDSPLCVYALVLRAEKTLKVRDLKGNTPLHVAIIASNTKAAEILINHGASLSTTNSSGHSPRQLALSMKNEAIVTLIDQKRSGKQINIPAKKDPVDMERIMKVWERFFENALSGVDFTLDNEPESSVYDRSDDYRSASAVSSKKYGRGLTDDDYDYREIEGEGEGEQGDGPSDEMLEYTIKRAGYYWFSCVLSYDESRIVKDEDWSEDKSSSSPTPSSYAYPYTPGSTDGYYIADCMDLHRENMELDDFLYSQEQHAVWVGYNLSPYYQTGELEWPYTVQGAIMDGWINFFDSTQNQCLWMHLPSGETEGYLPVGSDTLSRYLGLEPYREENGQDTGQSHWLRPPQVASRSWVMIRCYYGGGGGTGIAEAKIAWEDTEADAPKGGKSTGGYRDREREIGR